MFANDAKKFLNSNAAFTLLETLLVLFIFTIMLGLVTPHFINNDRNDIRHAAIRFKSIVQWLNEQAASTGNTYRLKINLREQEYESLILAGDEYKKVTNQLVALTKIDSQTVEIQWADSNSEISQTTEVDLDFYPLGPKQPILASFSSKDDPKTGLSVLFIPGQLQPQILDGIKTWQAIENVAN